VQLLRQNQQCGFTCHLSYLTFFTSQNTTMTSKEFQRESKGCHFLQKKSSAVFVNHHFHYKVIMNAEKE